MYFKKILKILTKGRKYTVKPEIRASSDLISGWPANIRQRTPALSQSNYELSSLSVLLKLSNMYKCIMSIGKYSVGDLLTQEEFDNLLSFEERVCFKLVDRETQLDYITKLSQEIGLYDEDDYDSSEETEEWSSSDGSSFDGFDGGDSGGAGASGDW